MSRFISLSFPIAWLFIAPGLKAQQDHCNAWARTTLSYSVSPKIKIDGEFQHRRQSGFGNKDCLEDDLMYTLRSWIHYQHNESVKFSVSPVAYFSHHRIIQQESDVLADPVREIRFSAAADLQHELFRKFFVTARNAAEYRIFRNNTPDITRMRNRLGVRYDFMPGLKAGFYGELFVNLSGSATYYFFDHKRKAFTLEYSLTPWIKVETGYIHIIRLPPGNLAKIRENNLFLNLTFLLHRQRKQPGSARFPACKSSP